MTYQGQVGTDGESISMPPEVVRALGLEAGREFRFDVAGKTIMIRASEAPSEVLAELRDVMRGYTLDQFLVDRKRDGGE